MILYQDVDRSLILTPLFCYLVRQMAERTCMLIAPQIDILRALNCVV